MGPFEDSMKSCTSMKAIRAESKQQQGLKEAYQSSVENPRRLVETSFEMLELKGNSVKIFKPNNQGDEIATSLNTIDSKITSVATIPHHQAKLDKYPHLKKFMDTHLTKTLYMLQYRKCDNFQCCQRKKETLPPKIPSPVLSPDRVHYLSFHSLYGKVQTTASDCPSLQPKNVKKDKNEAGFKFVASRVVAKIQCHQCNKTRCVFSLDRTFSAKDQRELEDVIYVCGMVLTGAKIYTSRLITCSSYIENAFYISSAGANHICVHCGHDEMDTEIRKELLRKFKTVYPSCLHCKVQGKEEITRNEIVIKKRKTNSQNSTVIDQKATASASHTEIEIIDQEPDGDDDIEFNVEHRRKTQKSISLLFTNVVAKNSRVKTHPLESKQTTNLIHAEQRDVEIKNEEGKGDDKQPAELQPTDVIQSVTILK